MSFVQTVVLMAVAHTALVVCFILAGRAPVSMDGKELHAPSPWKRAATVALMRMEVIAAS